jgi:hypothetical protein
VLIVFAFRLLNCSVLIVSQTVQRNIELPGKLYFVARHVHRNIEEVKAIMNRTRGPISGFVFRAYNVLSRLYYCI